MGETGLCRLDQRRRHGRVCGGAAASESTLARIIGLVEEAREAKAPTQRFIDRFEQGYAATVIFAAAVAIVVPVALGEAFRRRSIAP